MKVWRMTGVAAAAALVGVGGMIALAPEVHGQMKRKIVGAGPQGPVVPDSGVSVMSMGDDGGSRIGIAVRDVEDAEANDNASANTKQKPSASVSGASGAVIVSVEEDTPAAKAGLKVGDVVTSFDGERVRSARQLGRLVAETPVGRTVKLSVSRGGSNVDVQVTPEASASGFAKFIGPRFEHGEFPKELRDKLHQEFGAQRRPHGPKVEKFERFGFPALEFDWDEGHLLGKIRGRLGVTADGVSDQLASYFGVSSGVLVHHVAEDSPAAKAGVKAGDVITAVNGKPVEDADDLRREVAESGGEAKELTLSVTRDKKPLSLKATIEPPQQVRPRIRRVV